MKSAWKMPAAAATTLALLMQGCATPPPECCAIPPYPAEGPDNNARHLEAAVDRLVERTKAGGALYSYYQYADRVVMQAQFNEAAMLNDFKEILYRHIAPTQLPQGIGECIKDHIVKATFWDFQQRMQGPRFPVPRQEQVGGSLFSTTWNNVALYCGVQNPEALKSDVNEGWRRAAVVVDLIKFGRY